jgi:hypothetical protein
MHVLAAADSLCFFYREKTMRLLLSLALSAMLLTACGTRTPPQGRTGEQTYSPKIAQFLAKYSDPASYCVGWAETDTETRELSLAQRVTYCKCKGSAGIQGLSDSSLDKISTPGPDGLTVGDEGLAVVDEMVVRMNDARPLCLTRARLVPPN